MDNPEILEGYMIRSGTEYEQVSEGTWVLHDDVDHVDNIVVTLSPPVVVFTVRLMDVPEGTDKQTALFKKLLELNAGEMVAGAYALSDGGVIITETLQSENLDYNEFQAAIDSLTMAITEHYPELKAFHELQDEEEAAA